MSIRFNGTELTGSHGNVVPEPPRGHVIRRKFWGLHGESETRGGRGGRNIVIPFWMHDGYDSREAAIAGLEDLDELVNTHGDLVVTGEDGAARTFPDCTFEGFTISEGPIPGLITADGDGGYVTMGMLNFYQISAR